MDKPDRQYHEIHELIRHLLSVSTAATLYSLNHPQVERLIKTAWANFEKVFSKHDEIKLIVIDNELVIDGVPQQFSMVLDRFVQILSEHGISQVRLLSSAKQNDLIKLIALLANHTDPDSMTDNPNIILGQVTMLDQPDALSVNDDTLSSSLYISRSEQIHRNVNRLEEFSQVELERMGELYEAVRNNGRIKVSNIASSVTDLLTMFKKEGEAMMLLAALREKDEYTFTHSTNVCILTLAQASSLGISGQMLSEIGIAAMMHDIGKLFIPETVLNKKDRLTEEEFVIMKSHTVRGANYLTSLSGMPRLAAVAAFEHHLRFDARGYPAVPAGWEQNLASQMVVIGDCFDAMRTRRPYQEPRPVEVIANVLMQGSGTEFNPLLVKNMLSMLGRVKII